MEVFQIKDHDGLSNYYPDIENWFECKVIEELGERRLILVLINEEKLIGFSILKIDETNGKISTFYILEGFINLGYGRFLFDYVLKFLKKSKENYEILISVSEPVIYKFKSLLNNNGFKFK